ncbi:MAG: hypothetical protein ABIH03_13640, partial [Pseudomonadota bacterium]
MPDRITGFRSGVINGLIDFCESLRPMNTRTVRHTWMPSGVASEAAVPLIPDDVLPWAITDTDPGDDETDPTVTTGDGYFVTHYNGGTRYDKLTGESPDITGTGVLVAEMEIDSSTEDGTWTTAWKYITDAGITTLATAYSGMTAAGKSDGSHIRVPIWFVERA